MSSPSVPPQLALNGRTTGRDVAATFGTPGKVVGLTFLITGSTGGLGLATAKEIAQLGAKVVLVGRGQAGADTAVAAVRSSIDAALWENVSSLLMDLADLSTVKAAAESYLASGQPLDCLINNAGIMAPPLELTKDGFESQFGVNHIGHFYLTSKLLPLLRKSSYARVINLSSIASYIFPSHKVGFDLENWDCRKGYDRWVRYGESKLCNLLHAKEITKREAAIGSPVVAYSVHPGYIAETGLMRFFNVQVLLHTMIFPRSWVLAFDMKNTQQGIATTLYAALAPSSGTHHFLHILDYIWGHWSPTLYH
jgi:retinol dehydrogenase 12